MTHEEQFVPSSLAMRELEILRRDLSTAQAEIRALQRQMKKAEEAAQEARRAHAKMVETLTETMRENMLLTGERDNWRQRAARFEAEGSVITSLELTDLVGAITESEAKAIRKAMARLHHPDLGGDPERMKQWNSALDRLCRD